MSFDPAISASSAANNSSTDSPDSSSADDAPASKRSRLDVPPSLDRRPSFSTLSHLSHIGSVTGTGLADSEADGIASPIPIPGPRSQRFLPSDSFIPSSSNLPAELFNRIRIEYSIPTEVPEYRKISNNIRIALENRRKFVFVNPRDVTQYPVNEAPAFEKPNPKNIPPATNHSFEIVNGVFRAWKGSPQDNKEGNEIFIGPPRSEYGAALHQLIELCSDGPARSFTHNRLQLLESRFKLHELLNHEFETMAQKAVPHRDFYNVRKIDNHVHHSACMNQKHLLRFIKHKLKSNPPEIVIVRDGKSLTLAEVFESLRMTPYDLNVDTLDMHADKTFHRFDKFNLKYNPIGECWAAGTQLLMFDGSMKSVESIVADSRAGEQQFLMGDDGNRRLVIPGSSIVGNTADEEQNWSAPPFSLMPIKPTHSVADGRRARADGLFECRYQGCDRTFSTAGARSAHEDKEFIHSLPSYEKSPSMYRITSKIPGFIDFTCNNRHILVLKFDSKPIGPLEYGNQSNKNSSFYIREIIFNEKSQLVEMRNSNFNTKSEAQRAMKRALDNYQPLIWESTVDQFLQCDQIIQNCAVMFQAQLPNNKEISPQLTQPNGIIGIPFITQKVSHNNYYGFQLDGNGRCLLNNSIITHNSRLREVFLKYSNQINGKYLAEITQQVFDDLEANKYQFAEYRISIYGSSTTEWDILSKWVVENNLFSSNVRWMIQIPRLYGVYKSAGKISNFSDMIKNIFLALFEVSINPASHPQLHTFLLQCVGFDIVDDESVREKNYTDSLPNPDEWNGDEDPPYALFAYYIYVNLYGLNRLRASKGLTTFSFRPHSGEAGDVEHLACAFLLAKSINHGLQLFKSPSMQYLYYLAQIGISMSPLSNNLLFLEYEKNPFPRFFARGMNVTLSTDDPLMIHVTKEPLVEEYSVAAQVWKLTSVDMSEIARNSVIQSDFEHRYKSHFLGNNYWIRGVDGNDLRQTNVPAIRVQFRADLLNEELELLSNQGEKVPRELMESLWV